MTKVIQMLSVLVLAFAHVRGLDEHDELALCSSYELLHQHGLIKRINPAFGSESSIDLDVDDDSWFNALALLLVGHLTDIDRSATCLLSDRGWNVYMNTFRAPDLKAIEPGFFTIQPGVPVRNGVRKHAIIDGPATGIDGSRWAARHKGGESIALSCFDDVEHGNSQHGERRDAFVLSLRLPMPEVPNSQAIVIRRTRTRELNAALWTSETTEPCDHVVDVKEQVMLSRGCAAVSGFGENGMGVRLPLPNEKILVCLQPRTLSFRWRALIAIKSERKDKKYSERILLHKSDYCPKCAIAQSKTR